MVRLVKMCRNGNSCLLLAEMQTGITTLKNVLWFLKTKTELTYDPSVPFLECIPKGNEISTKELSNLPAFIAALLIVVKIWKPSVSVH